MKKILWVSKNKPIPSQVNELRRLFGKDCVIDIHDKPFSHAAAIAAVFKAGEYDEMVLIAPLTVCRLLTEYGYKPLYSEMQITGRDEAEIEVYNTRERLERTPRHYRFKKFKRMERIELVFSEIIPTLDK